MRRRLVILAVLACGGCARLIGAQFDDAKLADEDASVPNDASALDDVGALADVPTLDARAAKDASPFDAFAPGDLQLWLAADRGVTQASSDAGDGGDDADAGPSNGVAAWEDLSGHGHGGTQSVGPLRPVLIDNALAGKPVVSFVSARETCLTTSWSDSPGGVAATIFAVTQGSPDSLLRFQGTVPGVLVFPLNVAAPPAQDLRFLVSGTQAAFMRLAHDPIRYDLMTARLNPNVFGGAQTWRNGKLVEQSSFFADAMPATDVFTIGCYFGGGQFADGAVAEVLYYNAALGDRARIEVETYLRERWNLVF